MQLAPSALHATAEALASLLGPWQTADPADDGTIHLHGPFERHIGMRLVHGGSTIQLWATGGITPAADDDTSAPLPTGRRWHTTCHIGSLTEDQDPAVELFTTIHDNLLPVFDTKPAYVGHRPWQLEDTSDFDQADVEAAAQQAAAASVDLDDQSDPEPAPTQPQPDPEPKAEPAAEPTPEASAKRAPKKPRTTAATLADAQRKPRPARKRVPKASSA